MFSRALLAGGLLLGFVGPPKRPPAPKIHVDQSHVTTEADVPVRIPIRTSSKEKLSYKLLSEPNHGSYPVDGPPDRFTYTPQRDFHAVDNFRIRAETADGIPSNAIDITVTVNPPPKPEGNNTGSETAAPTTSVEEGSRPPAQQTTPASSAGGKSETREEPPVVQSPEEAQEVPFNTPQTIALKATGAGPLTFSVTRQPKCGKAEFPQPRSTDKDPTVIATYIPTDKCSGDDSFSFKAKRSNSAESSDESNEATVTLKVARSGESDLGLAAIGRMLAPGVSVLLGLVAVVWAFVLKRQADDLRRIAEAEQAHVQKRLGELEGDLAVLEGKKTIVQETSTSRGSRDQRVKEETTFSRGQGVVTHTKPRQQSSQRGYSAPQQTQPQVRTGAEPERIGVIRAAGPPAGPLPPSSSPTASEGSAYPTGSESHAYPSPPTPAAATQDPARLEKSGDVIADFNRAQKMGHEGHEWFLTSYRCVVLSCRNLSERRRNPAAELRFVEDPRGLFLGVQHEGQTVLLPAMDKDVDVAQTYLEGPFAYLGDPDESFQLLRPGTLRADGAEWVLEHDGEIGRG